jgi:hypothetical protein
VGDINLEVWDATGNKRLKVTVPNDVAVERILMVLADKLQLLDDQTLSQQQVVEDDIVRIQPEITAG